MQFLPSLIIAFATYSRIPMPKTVWNDENRKYAFCFFPLIGCVIGLVFALWLKLCDMLSIDPLLRGCVAAALPLLVTGGIHMDGFMDTCDALASWQLPEKRLLILKDSHVGAFAVIGCSLYLLLAAGLLSECTARDALPLGSCFVLSRALSAYLSISMPQARSQGMLSGFANTANKSAILISSSIYAVLCLIALIAALGPGAAFPIACIALTVLYYCRMSIQAFGGVTGDLAGWFLQTAELACTAGIVLGGKLL